MRTIVGFIAAATLLSGAGVPTGYEGGSGRKRDRLTVSYLADAGFAAAVKLDCNPVGGGHPGAVAACAALEAAGGDPGRIPVAHTACMMIYAPVAAEVTGTWRGRKVEWRQRYGNTCEMRRATGALFAF